MINIRHTIYIVSVAFAVFVFGYMNANAITFTPSEQLFTDQRITTFAGLAQWLFPVTLSIVAILAVFMIMRAGFTLVFSADNPSSRADARGRIMNAIIGLVIAFGSVLILRTINPNLINLRFNVGDPLTRPEALYEGTNFGQRQGAGNRVLLPSGLSCDTLRQCLEGWTCVQGTCVPNSRTSPRPET